MSHTDMQHLLKTFQEQNFLIKNVWFVSFIKSAQPNFSANQYFLSHACEDDAMLCLFFLVSFGNSFLGILGCQKL